MPQVTVKTCPGCWQRQVVPIENQIQYLESEVEDLKTERVELREEIAELRQQLSSAEYTAWNRLTETQKDQILRLS